MTRKARKGWGFSTLSARELESRDRSMALCDPKGAAASGGSDDVEYRVLKQYPFTRVRSWTNEVSRTIISGIWVAFFQESQR